MDTVLGLAMTPTTVGWVLVEGHDADGAILDHDDFGVRTGGGLRAMDASEQVAAAVLRAQATATVHEHRLHLVGVTWSDDAVAEAALLVESLTHNGFDNVVPVRLVEAIDALARGVAEIIGYEQTAVCVLDRESTSVVLVGTAGDGTTRTTAKHVTGGATGLTRWLTTMFDRSRWVPDAVILVGSDSELDAVARQLEVTLPVAVVTQGEADLAVARGAALASAQRMQFTDPRAVAARAVPSAQRTRSRPLSYVGALTMLGTGAATLVASLTLAVGLRLDPHDEPGQLAARTSATPSPAEAMAPPGLPPGLPPGEVSTAATQSALKPAPPEEQEPPVVSPAAPEPQGASGDEQVQEASTDAPAAAPVDPPVAGPVSPPPVQQPVQQPTTTQAVPAPPPNPHPLLTRILERLHGDTGDSAPSP